MYDGMTTRQLQLARANSVRLIQISARDSNTDLRERNERLIEQITQELDRRKDE